MRLFAALLILIGTSTVGFGACFSAAREIRQLRQLQAALTVMKNEMTYKAAELPQMLCTMKQTVGGSVGAWLALCGEKMLAEPMAEPAGIIMEALENTPELCFARSARNTVFTLAGQLGSYDTEGQLRAIALAEKELTEQTKLLEESRTERSRSYKTLGICSGLAIAVILL